MEEYMKTVTAKRAAEISELQQSLTLSVERIESLLQLYWSAPSAVALNITVIEHAWRLQSMEIRRKRLELLTRNLHAMMQLPGELPLPFVQRTLAEFESTTSDNEGGESDEELLGARDMWVGGMMQDAMNKMPFGTRPTSEEDKCLYLAPDNIRPGMWAMHSVNRGDCTDFLKFANFLEFSQIFSRNLEFSQFFFDFLEFSQYIFSNFSQISILTTRDFGGRRQITSYATEKIIFKGVRVSITRA